MQSLSFSRELEIRHEVDVFIAGGGPAGCAAAIAAARQADVRQIQRLLRSMGMYLPNFHESE